jgi:DNA-binding transcriptional LysR family regulator
MEMHEVRYFLAVCDTLNFTRAAERCNVSQPSLTRAIQKLEAEFGGLLFRRERAATHLTDLGSLVRPQLERIAKDAESVKKARSMSPSWPNPIPSPSASTSTRSIARISSSPSRPAIDSTR